jgi:hypothetical protein
MNKIATCKDKSKGTFTIHLETMEQRALKM